MAQPSTWLLELSHDVYSQAGEDGIIEAILELLPSTDKWCVEFGAWDGVSLSNTRNLINHKGFSSVLIEGNEQRFLELRRNCSRDTNTIPINRFVGFGNDDNLDHILSNTPIPKDFDFLSIDIDGNDYHAWQAMSAFTPKVVCVEFNPTIPPSVRFVQEADPSVNQGSSLLSLVDLGKKKGYELISVSRFNAFFVRADYAPLYQIADNSPAVLWTQQDWVTYLFSGFDGRVFLRGGCMLPWHKVPLREKQLQVLPRILRSYPGNYTYVQKLGFAAHLLIHNPRSLFKEIRDRGSLLRKRLTRRRASPRSLHSL